MSTATVGRLVALVKAWLVAGVLGTVLPGVASAVAAAAETPAAPGVPVLPPGTIELSGSLAGAPVWARVLPADQRFGGNRLLQLSWQPPPPEQLAGARLVDCPFILLDAQARVVAWNGRDGLSQVVPGVPDGYQVTRELTQPSGTDAVTVPEHRHIHCGRAWDLHLAPLLMALTWHPGSSASVAVVDLYGGRAAERLTASWHDTEAIIAGAHWHILGDRTGHVVRITDATTGTSGLDVAQYRVEGNP